MMYQFWCHDFLGGFVVEELMEVMGHLGRPGFRLILSTPSYVITMFYISLMPDWVAVIHQRLR